MAIELEPDEHAEPGQCGSCKFFQRDRGFIIQSGWCKFRLPPKALLRPEPTEELREDGAMPTQMVRDSDGCDFYKVLTVDGSRPEQFVQKRYWHAGMPR